MHKTIKDALRHYEAFCLFPPAFAGIKTGRVLLKLVLNYLVMWEAILCIV